MNIKNKVYKIFKPSIKTKKDSDDYDINNTTYYTSSTVSNNKHSHYIYPSDNDSNCHWESGYGESVITPILDIERDCNTKIYINKNNRKYEMTRKQLYRLVFMLEDDNESIDSCPLYLFENYLTAVKI